MVSVITDRSIHEEAMKEDKTYDVVAGSDTGNEDVVARSDFADGRRQAGAADGEDDVR